LNAFKKILKCLRPEKSGVGRACRRSGPAPNQFAVRDTAVKVQNFVNRPVAISISNTKYISIDSCGVGIYEEAFEMEKDWGPSVVRVTPYIKHFVQGKICLFLFRFQVNYQSRAIILSFIKRFLNRNVPLVRFILASLNCVFKKPGDETLVASEKRALFNEFIGTASLVFDLRIKSIHLRHPFQSSNSGLSPFQLITQT